MKTWYLLSAIAVFLFVYGAVYFFEKKKKPLLRASLTMVFGVFSLVLVDVLGMYTGVYLPISALSLGISGVFGVPGVGVMLIIEYFL